MAILEIAIATQNNEEGRIQEGDIVVARKPLGYVGKKEQSKYLWLIVETDLSLEELMENNLKTSRKREKFIPLNALNSNGFEFEMDKVKDSQIDYQPGLNPNMHNGSFRNHPTPKNVDHLIKSKK